MYKSLYAIITAVSIITFSVYSSPEDINGGKTLPDIIELVSPAVVHIEVQGTQKLAKSLVPDMFNSLFEDGANKQNTYKKFGATGTGVIIHSDKGLIVTNYHVIENSDNIWVILKDGRKIVAELVGSDPLSDIALLKIKAKGLVQVKIANSNRVRVGDSTIAIGGPYGLIQTVTTGIVSALDRTMSDSKRYKSYIQTDADINSGNSGGALLNSSGELIGINTAIISPNGGGSAGLGFAIPSNMMYSLVQQILAYGKIKRAALGISGLSIDSDIATELGLDKVQGVLVDQVLGNSGAARSGLQAGDIIIGMNGRVIKDLPILRTRISYMGHNNTVNLVVIRKGQHITLIVKLGLAK